MESLMREKDVPESAIATPREREIEWEEREATTSAAKSGPPLVCTMRACGSALTQCKRIHASVIKNPHHANLLEELYARKLNVAPLSIVHLTQTIDETFSISKADNELCSAPPLIE